MMTEIITKTESRKSLTLDLEEVSIMVIGTRSGKKSIGRRVGGRTGGTFSGKASLATEATKLDLPVPWSPAMTTRTPLRTPETEFLVELPAIE